jgi:hypothetical protein
MKHLIPFPRPLLLLAALALAGCPMSTSSGGGDSSGGFDVRVVSESSHPDPAAHTVVYEIDGVQGRTIDLVRGTTYTFNVMTPGHPFYITTDGAGGAGFPGEVTTGVTNSRATSGTLTFTPDASHPDLLYYQCGVHALMGFEINISDP